MRSIFLAVLVALGALPAFAQDGGRYVNERYGFAVAVPPDFASRFSDPETELFVSADGRREIMLLGGNALETLETLAGRHMGYDAQDGWATRLLASTPAWVAYAGTRNGMQLFVRMIEICPGWQFARVQVTYPERDAVSIAPLLDQLGASFRATGTADCPD